MEIWQSYSGNSLLNEQFHLTVCLCTRYLKKLRMDSDEILCRCLVCDNDKLIRFWWRSESRSGHENFLIFKVILHWEMSPKRIHCTIFQKFIGPDMFYWIRHSVVQICTPSSALLIMTVLPAETWGCKCEQFIVRFSELQRGDQIFRTGFKLAQNGKWSLTPFLSYSTLTVKLLSVWKPIIMILHQPRWHNGLSIRSESGRLMIRTPAECVAYLLDD